MDVDTLAQRIAAALRSSPFAISGALLESPAITQVLTGVLGEDRLALTGASLVSQNATEVVVEGQTAQALAGDPGQHATVTFTVAGGVAQLHLALDRLPSSWTPSASFAQLRGSLFDAFSYTTPLLTLDSLDPPALPVDFPEALGYPPYSSAIGAAMVPGLGLQATIAPLAGGGPLETLLAGSAWPVSGAIVLPASQLSIALTSGAQPGVSAGTFSIPFALTLASVAVQPQPSDPIVLASALQLAADVTRQLRDGSVVTVPFVLRMPSAQASPLVIESAFPARTGITPEQIVELIGGEIAGQMPASFPVLDEIELERVALTLAPEGREPLLSASATIGWIAPRSFEAFAGLLRFEELAVTFTYLPAGFGTPAGALAHVSTDVAAQATVAGGTLDAELPLPELVFNCELAAGTQIDITSLVQAAADGSVSMPQMACTTLQIWGDIPGGSYRFQAVVTDDWSFSLGTRPLVLRQITLDIERGPPGISGQIGCQVEIAGTELLGTAAYEAATSGWAFGVGTVGPARVNLTELAGEVLELLGLRLPDTAPALMLEALSFFFDTATRRFGFQCATTLTIAGTQVSTGLNVTNEAFSALVWVGASYFEVDFTTGDQRELLSARWQATEEQADLGFADVADALGMSAPALPEGLDLRLAAASLSYEFATGLLVVEAQSRTYGSAIFLADPGPNGTRWFAGLAVGHPIELSNLPLLGAVLGSGASASIGELRVILSSADIDEATARALDASIATGYPSLPSTGTASVLGLSATVAFGATRIPISLGMGDVAQGGGQSGAGNTVVGLSQGGANVPTTTPAASDGTVWFNVQRSFGPVTLEKVGARYEAGVLWFRLNGSISAGGLSLSLLGASIGSPLTSFEPQFELQGIGLDYACPPLEIGGGFAKATPTGGAEFEYDGSVVVRATGWGLTVYGSYAQLDRHPSLFLFAQVEGTFGGPPEFLVTGIVGGFGYNSALRIPGASEVVSCPLVAGLTDPSVVGGARATPMQALARLTGGANPWVTHELGETWIAAGLSFTTYELLQSTALLVVEFGDELTIALLGLSTARFPPEREQPAYAEVQLQLEALLQPGKGFFGITAELTRNSFLLDPACRLTGGFAFYLWFGLSEHPGDFVVTLGGYHAGFEPPPWYPVEPRLGFAWSLSDNVSISGSAYFALTPSAAMAGGGLSITFQDGNLRAWFVAWADMIVRWRPFSFNVSIGVSIGASYRIHVLGASVTLRAQLGAELTLWGPPTGGVAHVHWYVISFTVRFGAEPPSAPALRTWTDFAPLLPAAPDTITFAALGGLAASPAAVPADAHADALADPAPEDGWQVRLNGFAFVARGAIPATELYVGSRSAQPYRSGDRLTIRPLQQGRLTATQRLSVTLEGEEVDLAAEGWRIDATTGNVPKALWGEGTGEAVEPGDRQLVEGQLTGFSLAAPEPALGWSSGPIDVAATLGFDPLTPDGTLPFASGEIATGDVPVAGRDAVRAIEQQLAGSGRAPREALAVALAALGSSVPADEPLTRFAAAAPTAFAGEPLLVPEAG